MWRTEAGTGVRLSAQSRGRGVPRQVRGCVSPPKAADEAYRGRYAGPSLRTRPRTRRTEAGTRVRLSAQGRGRGVPRQVRGSVSPHKAADEAYRGRYAGPSLRTRPSLSPALPRRWSAVLVQMKGEEVLGAAMRWKRGTPAVANAAIP